MLLRQFYFFFLLLVAPAIFGQNASVIVIEHRGGRAEFVETTIAAVKGAYKEGVRSFEADYFLQFFDKYTLRYARQKDSSRSALLILNYKSS